MQGMNYSLAANILLGESAGICAMLSVLNNPVDEAALKNEFDPQSVIRNLTISTSDWKATSILVGLCTSTSEGGRFAFDMRFMFGIALCTSPEVKISVNYINTIQWSMDG